MKNFVYENPTRIHFGKGCIDGLGTALAALEIRKILLVFGQGSIHRNGVYTAVKDAVHKSDIEIIEHGGVQGNPRLAHVRAGVEKARTAAVDGILAVGGGSVVDAAKAIAAVW